MALTVSLNTRKPERVGQHLRMIVGTFNCDNSYATGGYDLSTPLGKYLRSIYQVVCDQTAGYLFQFDKANSKLKVLYPTKSASAHTHTFTGTALAAHGHKALTVKASETAADATAFVSITEGDGTAQAGVKVANAGGGTDIDIDTEAVTAGTPAGTNSNAGAISASAGEEVGNGADLSSLTDISFVAVGR